MMRRFHLVRRVSDTAEELPVQRPWGYLLNLAAKHWHCPSAAVDESAIIELLELSTAYTAIHGVQPYSRYESTFVGAKDLPEFLQRTVIYDSLFGFFQLRVTDASRLYKALLAEKLADKKCVNGVALSDAVRLADTIINKILEDDRPRVISPIQLAKLLNVRPAKVITTLDAVLAHPVGKVNKDYTIPTDASACDFQERPLVKQADGNYVVISPPICGPAFVSALLRFGGTGEKNYFEHLGNQAEKAVRVWLSDAGVVWNSGKYRTLHNGSVVEGECDIVVETDDTIFFVESKNKSLRHSSRAGRDDYILADLALGAVHASSQAMRHELLLKENSVLNLDDDGKIYSLEWRDRHIERVAISLPEFGVLQDRLILHSVLDGFLRADFKAISDELKRDFSQVQRISADFRNVCVELVDAGADGSRLFFENWYLSFAQLLILLDKVSSNSTFKQQLWKTRNISMGTHDWYHEYRWRTGLEGSSS